jgi:hypothetical protein
MFIRSHKSEEEEAIYGKLIVLRQLGEPHGHGIDVDQQFGT